MTKAERMSDVIREVQSICLEHVFLTGHFKGKEFAPEQQWIFGS